MKIFFRSTGEVSGQLFSIALVARRSLYLHLRVTQPVSRVRDCFKTLVQGRFCLVALRSHTKLMKAMILGEAGVEQVFSSSHGLTLSLIFIFFPGVIKIQ